MPLPLDAARAWTDFEDRLAPGLRLDATERALYSHLFRHTHLEGTRALLATIGSLGLRVGLTHRIVSRDLQSLIRKGCLRWLRESHEGILLEVLAPHEIPSVAAPRAAPLPPWKPAQRRSSPGFRRALLRRERFGCFYCRRRLSAADMEVDHIVPRSKGGDHSASNLVACCRRCNRLKFSRPAEQFLRLLYRRKTLSASDLADRLRALVSLRGLP